MIIYSEKLDRYVQKAILPKILLLPNRYNMTGSFSRKIPYITDIDIFCKVFPTINRNNIYQYLRDFFIKFQRANYPDIIFLYVTVSDDERFIIRPETFDEDIERIFGLISIEEQERVKWLINKHSDKKKAIFFIREYLKEYLKMRWHTDEIIANRKILPGEVSVKMTDVLAKSKSVLFKYFVMIGRVPVGIDNITVYVERDRIPVKSEEILGILAKEVLQPNYENSVFYMLFPIRAYFKVFDQEKYQELYQLIEYDYGIYKQLFVRIEDYHKLYETGHITIDIATALVRMIIVDLREMDKIQTNIPKQLKEIGFSDETDENKIRRWALLLDVLNEELQQCLNVDLEETLYEYLQQVPENLRSFFCFRYDELEKKYSNIDTDSDSEY